MVYIPKHDVMSSLPPPVTALPTQSTFLLRIDERTQSKDPLHTPDAATERLTEWPLTSKGTASNGGKFESDVASERFRRRILKDRNLSGVSTRWCQWRKLERPSVTQCDTRDVMQGWFDG